MYIFPDKGQRVNFEKDKNKLSESNKAESFLFLQIIILFLQ